MDFPLGTRRQVEDVKNWGFTELGLQGCEGVLLGSTPQKGYIGMGQGGERCSSFRKVADTASEALSKANK